MQTRFTLRQLEYLVAVGQHGSVTLAAEQLSVSAPSISTAISALEAEFGLPLFVRKHAQGMSPTTGGRDLSEKIRYYLDHEDERLAIAQRGYEYVRNGATIDVRARELVGFLKAHFGP